MIHMWTCKGLCDLLEEAIVYESGTQDLSNVPATNYLGDSGNVT